MNVRPLGRWPARASRVARARALMWRIAVICVLRLSNYVVCNKKDTREDMRVSTTVLNTHRKRSSGSAVHEHVHEPNGAASFADDSQTRAGRARSFGSRSVTVTVKGRSSSSTRGRYRRSSVPVPSPLPSRADLHRAREAVTDAVSRRVLVDVARVGAISFDKAVRPRDPFAMLLKWQQARRDEAA